MTDPKTKDGWLIKYINDIRAEERERCAKMVEDTGLTAIAAAIRALGDE
jgi:hypothetical protein